MRNINRIQIGGIVGGDADVAVTKSGREVCRFSMAYNRNRRNEATGQWETLNTTWWSVSYFGQDAEALAGHIKKGTRVVVSGQAEMGTYEGRDGQPRSVVRVMADSVSVVPDLRGGRGQFGGGHGSQGGGQFGGGQGSSERPPF